MEIKEPIGLKYILAEESLIAFLIYFPKLNKAEATQKAMILSESLSLLEDNPNDLELLNIIIAIALEAKYQLSDNCDEAVIWSYDELVECIKRALPEELIEQFLSGCTRQ